MYISMYADPVQGITITYIGENGAYAVPTFYEDYMDELIAMMTVNGSDVQYINVSGDQRFAGKIVQEIREEYPNVPVNEDYPF